MSGISAHLMSGSVCGSVVVFEAEQWCLRQSSCSLVLRQTRGLLRACSCALTVCCALPVMCPGSWLVWGLAMCGTCMCAVAVQRAILILT